MRGGACEESAGVRRSEALREMRSGLEAEVSEPGHQQGMMRNEADGTEDLVVQLARVSRERPHHSPIGLFVLAEAGRGRVDRQLERRGGAVVEWMRHRHRRI